MHRLVITICLTMALVFSASAAARANTPAPAPRATQSATTAPDPAVARATIVSLLRDQSAAWSRGDLDAFVAIYADDAIFITPAGMTRGREPLLARYRERYPDAAAMGTLTLEPLEWRFATDASGGAVGASLVARWTLRYPADAAREDATGLTLLVFLPDGDRWLIVQDASL